MNCTTPADPPKRSATHYALTVPRPERQRNRPQTQIGDVLGSYRLLELIGHGSMGRVYRAEHIALGRPVAVKVLHRHHARRCDAVARLVKEARAASRIHHRNIVEVIDYLEVDDETVCIVMELATGRSLRRLMDTPGALPPARALAILAQICDGLAAAHAAGIVHRDLKPDNVVVMRAPRGGDLVKLVDFGLAKLIDDDGDPRTVAGQVFGTPPYMSPEQSIGGAVDGRADLYSLGAIAYEIFAGRPPFAASTFREYAFKHATVAPPPPTSVPGHRVPDQRVESLILRCLAKNRQARHASAAELADDIRELGEPRVNRPSLALRIAVSLMVVAAAVVIGAVIAAASRSRHVAAAQPVPPPVAARVSPPSIVRLVSQPPAEVFRRDGSERLCETPCALAISPGRDRSARAVFVVRRPGYLEQSIAVDPVAPPSRVSLQLEREPPPHRRAHKPLRDADETLNPYRDGVE